MKCLNVDNNAAKSINILAISLNVLHNYLNGSNKIIFKSVNFQIYQQNCFFLCSNWTKL